MAAVDIKGHSEQQDVTLSGTANTAQEFRVYVADRVTVKSSSALELFFDEDDAASVSAGTGFGIDADTYYTIPVDRRQIALNGYFSFQLSSATSSAVVELVAETGKVA